MSRYDFPDPSRPNDWLVVGWDPPTATYFLQAQFLDAEGRERNEGPAIRMGIYPGNIPTVIDLEILTEYVTENPLPQAIHREVMNDWYSWCREAPEAAETEEARWQANRSLDHHRLRRSVYSPEQLLYITLARALRRPADCEQSISEPLAERILKGQARPVPLRTVLRDRCPAQAE